MKLSRRGKRTKCTKRTKNIKCRRNTKRHLNKYKRKNTYRKHSHKLRKNKRVMRGGVENFDVVYKKENVELEYTTSDDSLMNRARGFFNKLQRGNFTTELTCLKEKMKISFNRQSKPFIDFDFKNSNFSNEFANVTIEISSYNKNIYHVTFTLNRHDEYYFTLTITSKSDESKTFTVNFKVSVSSYKIIFDKRVNIDKYECYSIGYDISFSLGPVNEDYQDNLQNMTFTLPKPDQTTKTYTFPLSVEGSLNKKYFESVKSDIYSKIKEIIKQILETSISIRIKNSANVNDSDLLLDIDGKKTALVGQLRSQVAKNLNTTTDKIKITFQPSGTTDRTDRISLEDKENLESRKGTFYYEKVDSETSSDVPIEPHTD